MNEHSSQELPVWETFLRAHAAVIPLLEGDLARAGLIPLNRYDVLANLQTAGGSLRMRGLVSGVVLSQPSVSRLVNEMERDGQVRRDRDPGDRRGVVVSMTDRGAQDLARARSIHQRGIQEHFYRHVAAADEEPMRRALSRVLRAAASRSTAQA